MLAVCWFVITILLTLISSPLIAVNVRSQGDDATSPVVNSTKSQNATTGPAVGVNEQDESAKNVQGGGGEPTSPFTTADAPVAVGMPPGITERDIFLGSILPLEGSLAFLGHGIQNGLERALNGQLVGERRVSVIYEDDLYEPLLTPLKVNKLLKRGILAMIGNVGTPTTAAALPLLRKAGIPAVGFVTGTELLRVNTGMALNYRASYAQETMAIIDAALRAGIKSEQVCAYVQNDDYGKAGLLGIQMALGQAHAPQPVLDGLQRLFDDAKENVLVRTNGSEQTPINNNGPVGVYTRNHIEVKPGYTALKNWERKTGYRCALVIAIGVYENLAHFIHNSRNLQENWIVAVVSFAGADQLYETLQELAKFGSTTIKRNTSNLIMSQVTPALDSDLAIVQDARQSLGADFNLVSLEGYIVGKMMLEILRNTQPPLSREAFMRQAKLMNFDLGGLPIDFTRNGYQGANLVTITRFTEAGFRAINTQDWTEMLASAKPVMSAKIEAMGMGPKSVESSAGKLPTRALLSEKNKSESVGVRVSPTYPQPLLPITSEIKTTPTDIATATKLVLGIPPRPPSKSTNIARSKRGKTGRDKEGGDTPHMLNRNKNKSTGSDSEDRRKIGDMRTPHTPISDQNKDRDKDKKIKQQRTATKAAVAEIADNKRLLKKASKKKRAREGFPHKRED